MDAWLICALILGGSLQAGAQFSFIVHFPVINTYKDQPHVSCSNLDYTKSPPSEYLPQTSSDAQTGDFYGSCRACTPDNLCMNQFTIVTVSYDAFTGLNTPVTTCNPIDVNGNTVDLHSNVYIINMRTKGPSFAAPSGNSISSLGNGLQVLTQQVTIATCKLKQVWIFAV